MNDSFWEITEQMKEYYDYSNYPNYTYYSNFFFYQLNDSFNKEDIINDCGGNNVNNLNCDNEGKTREKTKGDNCQNKRDKEKLILNINKLINNNFVSSNNLKSKKNKKMSGRKRGRAEYNKNEHNKYSDDNIRRKCKHLVLKSLLEFINNKINKIYNGNIGNGIFKKELQTINQSQKFDATINFNILFLEKKLGDIFSENISGKYTNFPPNYNKIVIENLRNEKDDNKRIYFNKLFDLNFLKCLKHFRGENYIHELEGLKCFNDIKSEIIEKYPEDGEEYIENLDYYINNFETIIHNKRKRKPRKKISNE